MDIYRSFNSTMAPLKIYKVNDFNKTNHMKEFLVQLLLTKQWDNEFYQTLIESDDESESWHISVYAHNTGLVELSNEGNYKYKISVKGRKYIERSERNENDST